MNENFDRLLIARLDEVTPSNTRRFRSVHRHVSSEKTSTAEVSFSSLISCETSEPADIAVHASLSSINQIVKEQAISTAPVAQVSLSRPPEFHRS
ncbi:hypothetical protein NYQ83_17725, partial [Afifella sp. JA880]|uniref:hypothetical protein n=1 Tax=Afifella sp. JA880 TaxID=2975280 RepID=UPI0021BA6587